MQPSLLIKNRDDLKAAASEILAEIKDKDSAGALVVALSGDLGAGKTSFTQCAAEVLGIARPVRSPTSVIMESYDINWGRFHKFIHIDAYRLENEHELVSLDWLGLSADHSNFVFVEWPGKIANIIPSDAVRLNFLHVDHNTREIVFPES